jgi:endonuclease/exonuclease/phosphatase family metal-dependent hydrolase
MKSIISKVILYPVLITNILCAGLLLLSAYSPYFYPEDYPYLAISGLLFPVFLVVNACFAVFWVFVRWKRVFITLVACLLCYPQLRTCVAIHFQTKKIPADSFKVLSYNVMRFGNLEKKNDNNPILAYLKKEDVDILCMQEYDVSCDENYLTQKDIEKELSAYPYQMIMQRQLACYSKYPILSARFLDCKSNYNGAALFELKIGKDTVTLINCHLESNKLTKEDKTVYEDILTSPQTGKVKKGTRQLAAKLADASVIRANQARIVTGEISASNHSNVIVCGDFNDTSISYTHYIISQSLNDAFTETGLGLGVSYNMNRFYFRIDHILTSRGMKVYNCIVDHSIKDSDHYPIKCYITKQ